MNVGLILAVGLLALTWPQTILAQGALSADAASAVQITEARKANAALMRQYTWNSRTELTEQGEVKDTRIELVNYAPDGQLQRSLLNDQSAPLPRGFLRRAVTEDRKQEMDGHCPRWICQERHWVRRAECGSPRSYADSTTGATVA